MPNLDDWTRWGLWGAAAGFLPVGLLGWFAPDVLFDPLGVSFPLHEGLAEVRAAYGGLFCGAAALFVTGALRAEVRDLALQGVAVVLGGFVFGRLWSLAVDGVPGAVAWGTLGVESVGLVLALVLLGLRRRR